LQQATEVGERERERGREREREREIKLLGVAAAEVFLVQINKRVADFWYFDEDGLIITLIIYSRTTL
jgi:hypothetical protein